MSTVKSSLFVEPGASNYGDLVILNRYGLAETLIMEGYYQTAQTLLQKMVSGDVGDKDSLIYPALFAFRQYIELVIKDSTLKFQQANHKNVKGYPPIHDLTTLWGNLQKYLPDTTPIDANAQFVGDIITEIQNIDNYSTTFRYPLKRESTKPFLRDEIRCSLKNLQEKMYRVYSFFEGINALAHEAIA